MKTVVQLDSSGYFVGLTIADESQLEPGVYHIPANALDVPAPSVPDGKRAKWNGSEFVLEDIPLPQPAPEELPAPQPTPKDLRRFAYFEESDPLFFKAQRGEATLQQWLDKVAEIKARYPE